MNSNDEMNLTLKRFHRLLNTTTLADSDDDDGNAVAWVQKNREISKQKEEAAKRVIFFFEFCPFQNFDFAK